MRLIPPVPFSRATVALVLAVVLVVDVPDAPVVGAAGPFVGPLGAPVLNPYGGALLGTLTGSSARFALGLGGELGADGGSGMTPN
ncbi:MAG: hypothetical protein ACXV3S_11615 [Kineosporiaceae bacterium]